MPGLSLSHSQAARLVGLSTERLHRRTRDANRPVAVAIIRAADRAARAVARAVQIAGRWHRAPLIFMLGV
jgi:hypothetical protein